MERINYAVQAARRLAAQTRISMVVLLGLLVWSSLVSAGSLIATWEPNTEVDLAGYIVYYGTASGVYTHEVDVKNTTTFVATDLAEGEEYYFVVKAYDYSGNLSAPSAEVSGIVGGPMLVALRDNDTIRLVWTPVSGSTGYEVFRSTDPYFEPTTPIATLAATAKDYVDAQHFNPGEFESYYIVRAMNGATPSYKYNTVGAFDIELKTGLNLVSLPLVPADSSVQVVLYNELAGGQSSSQADQIRVWNGEEYELIWKYDGPAAEFQGKWINASTGLASRDNLDPNSSFWVLRQQNHQDSVLTVTGQVPTEPERSIALKTGYNFIGSVYPVSVALENSELYKDAVMKGGVGSGNADVIKAWDGAKYQQAWVVDGTRTDMDGVWMDETGKSETTISFNPGEGYIIWIKGDNQNKIWTFPNPALAE